MTKVDRVSREVIGNQLLMALDDRSKVAIVADETMLSFLIEACEDKQVHRQHAKYKAEMVRDLKELMQQAFWA